MSLGLNSACAHPGLYVIGCTVDVKKHGFECAGYPSTRFFRSYSDGSDMECASPQDVEDELKACKNGKLINITLCKLHPDLSFFDCKNPLNGSYELALSDADHYFCLRELDRKRMIERCEM